MPSPTPRTDELKRQLGQVDALEAQGVLGAAAAQEARAKLEKTLAEQPAPPEPAPRPSRRLVATVALFVLAFGIAGYAWRGNREGWAIGPGQGVAAVDDGAGHTITAEQIDAMLAKLVDRLKQQPNDPEGWSMLGRAYTALGRTQEAVAAYRKVVELKPRDAQALADLADGIAVAQDRSLAGEPERLVMQAVQLDPRNVKALALAGTIAFGRSDFRAAAGYWQRAVDAGDPASEITRQLQAAVAEAQQRAGMPASPPLAEAAPQAPAASGAAQASAFVAGRVTLAPALKSQVKPGDTVYVFARAASGMKIPLAILKRTASDLPFEFKLDDSLSMSPAARLSSASQVVIGARVSKSGDAMPQPGDLEGLSQPVALGTTGLQIEIAQPVR